MPRRGRFPVFLALSAVLIGGVTVFSGVIVGRFFEHYALDNVEHHTARIVENQAHQHLGLGAFDDPVTEEKAVRFREFSAGLPGVFRVKAFNPAGRIVWSNEPRLVGQTFPDNAFLARALAGRVVTVLETPERSEHVYERGKRYVAEAYVPIHARGRPEVVGVVETYADMTETMAGVRAVQRRIWTAGGVLGALLYGALAVIVWRASVGERRAITRLELQNQELRLIQQFTESVLIPLDREGLARSTVQSAGEALALARAGLYRVLPGSRLALVAAWPGGVADPEPPVDVVVGALTTGREVVRGTTVALPMPTPEGPAHLFVAEFSHSLDAVDPGRLRALQIMISEGAIALANVELFTGIRQAHQRLAAILAGVADRMHIIDRDMRVVWMNAAALEGQGTRGGVVGRACFETFGVDARACENCPAARTFESGRVERGVRVQRLPDGEVRYLDLVTAPLGDAAGAIHQVLEVARDITDLVQMEERLKQSAGRLEESHREVVAKAEELQRANRALRDAQAQLVEKERLAAVGEVVVGLHHAILNPLTGILGALQVLKNEASVAPPTRNALDEAEAEIHKIERIIRGLPSLRRATGTPYVGDTTMLDVERAEGEEI